EGATRPRYDGGPDRGDGCGDRAGRAGIWCRCHGPRARRYPKHRVNSGSEQVLGQCGGGAAGSSLRRRSDLLGAQIGWPGNRGGESRSPPRGGRPAARTAGGTAKLPRGAAAEPQPPPPAEIDRQLIYTLNPVLWREDGVVRRAPAFALVELPKCLLQPALRHTPLDYLNARRVQTLIHVHGSEGANREPSPDDPQLVDLDALAAQNESVEAVVA